MVSVGAGNILKTRGRSGSGGGGKRSVTLTRKSPVFKALTFLGHVIDAVGHGRALLPCVQCGEASVIVHKMVV